MKRIDPDQPQSGTLLKRVDSSLIDCLPGSPSVVHADRIGPAGTASATDGRASVVWVRRVKHGNG